MSIVARFGLALPRSLWSLVSVSRLAIFRAGPGETPAANTTSGVAENAPERFPILVASIVPLLTFLFRNSLLLRLFCPRQPAYVHIGTSIGPPRHELRPIFDTSTSSNSRRKSSP
ncbi:hypothetical protein F5883DRAFT_230504 [Diaporthe sp. PMI_573]|nr:hypothetical protein F5883DRAFT_230504 [Diaporthaceae sp. PMI_573]